MFGLFAVELAGFGVAVGLGLAVLVCGGDGLVTGELIGDGVLGLEGEGTGLAEALPGFCGIRGGEDEVLLEPFLSAVGFSGDEGATDFSGASTAIVL